MVAEGEISVQSAYLYLNDESITNATYRDDETACLLCEAEYRLA